MGAGCVQTMINVHRVLPGRRVLMVGSGNVGLIVAYQLLQAGAEVAAVVDVLPRVGGYPVHAAKVARAGVPVLTGHTVKEVRGDGVAEEATVWRSTTPSAVCRAASARSASTPSPSAVGLTPMAELAWLAGCRMGYVPAARRPRAVSRRRMATSVPGVFVAGDVSGVERPRVRWRRAGSPACGRPRPPAR